MSVPILAAAVTGFLGIAAWFLQRHVEQKHAEHLRREILYEKLLDALTEFSSFGSGAPFLIESQKAWLYASDEVLFAVNSLLVLFSDHESSSPTKPELRKLWMEREGAIRLAIRRDLHRSTRLDERWISTEWKPIEAPEKAIREYLSRR